MDKVADNFGRSDFQCRFGLDFDNRRIFFRYACRRILGAPRNGNQKSKVVILEVAKNSPAELAGILAGDELAGFSSVGDASSFISQNAGKEIEIKLRRNVRHMAVKPPRSGLTAIPDFSVKLVPKSIRRLARVRWA